jgi:hypothetical protein
MKKAGDFLASFLDTNLMEKAAGYSKLFSSWPGIAEEIKMPSLSDHSWIRELDKTVLLIEADHPGWIQLLQTQQGKLLNALRRRFPQENLSGISFRLSKEGPRPIPAEPERPTGQEPSAGQDQLAGQASSAGPVPEQAIPEKPAKAEQSKQEPLVIQDTRLRNALAALEKALNGTID